MPEEPLEGAVPTPAQPSSWGPELSLLHTHCCPSSQGATRGLFICCHRTSFLVNCLSEELSLLLVFWEATRKASLPFVYSSWGIMQTLRNISNTCNFVYKNSIQIIYLLSGSNVSRVFKNWESQPFNLSLFTFARRPLLPWILVSANQS